MVSINQCSVGGWGGGVGGKQSGRRGRQGVADPLWGGVCGVVVILLPARFLGELGESGRCVGGGSFFYGMFGIPLIALTTGGYLCLFSLFPRGWGVC